MKKIETVKLKFAKLDIEKNTILNQLNKIPAEIEEIKLAYFNYKNTLINGSTDEQAQKAFDKLLGEINDGMQVIVTLAFLFTQDIEKLEEANKDHLLKIADLIKKGEL